MRKYLGHMKCSKEKGLDSQNTNKKKFRTHEYPREKIADPQIPTRKILDPRNTHEKKILTH